MKFRSGRKKGWLVPLDNLGADYDVDDLLPAIRAGLTVDGKLYAAPFYGESSMVMYRKDLLEKAGLKMPDAPTWDFIGQAARAKITDKANEIYGVCLRGKAGWGENMAFLTATSNSFGARWFDENWKPQFDQPEWKDTLDFYLDLMKDAGPPGASSNGFNENLALFNCRQVRHVDRRHGRRLLRDQPQGLRRSPTRSASRWRRTTASASAATGCGPGRSPFPPARRRPKRPQKFIAWATSKDYLELVASKEGWANVPPGHAHLALHEPRVPEGCPFAKMTLDSINSADPTNPTVKPVPYVGVQFVAIPEFQGIATTVGQIFSAALAGEKTADEALAEAQDAATREMTKAGYIK